MKVWLPLHSDSPRVTLKSAADLVGIPVSSGRSLQGKLEKTLQIGVNPRDPLLPCFLAGPLLIVSQEIAQILKRFRGNLELFDAEIAHGKERITGQFYFVNILSECDCIDWRRSEFEELWGMKGVFRKLVLDPEVECPYDYFRLAQSSPAIICVSDALAMELSRESLPGLRFLEVEEFRSPDAI